MDLQFTLNGHSRQLVVRDDASLLEVLREQCGITSLKDGCSPQGQCGCCLALIDGHAQGHLRHARAPGGRARTS